MPIRRGRKVDGSFSFCSLLCVFTFCFLIFAIVPFPPDIPRRYPTVRSLPAASRSPSLWKGTPAHSHRCCGRARLPASPAARSTARTDFPTERTLKSLTTYWNSLTNYPKAFIKGLGGRWKNQSSVPPFTMLQIFYHPPPIPSTLRTGFSAFFTACFCGHFSCQP